MKDLENYIDYLLYQKKYSQNTAIGYKNDILLFFMYLEKESLNYLDIEYSDIRLYFEYLDLKKLSKTSINRNISALRNFYKYLLRNKLIDNNPFNLVSAPKKDKKLPKFLYQNEIEVLFNTPSLDDVLGIRDRLILEMLYATGIRVGEAELIKLKDIDFKNKSIRIIGKGNKERYVYFGSFAKEYLDLYLNKSRVKLDKNNSEYLFLNKNGTRLTARGIRLILDKVINKSSLDLDISPHTLRHSFATHMLEKGCDILSVQELLGHESLKATQVYTHITNDKLKEIYLKSHPRGKKQIK